MWDWRYPIDDLRKEIREAKSQETTSTTLVNLETLVDQIETKYERLEKEDLEIKKIEGESDYESRMKHWERYIAYYYDKVSEYNRLVIAGSFVAYFAVWSRLSDLLERSLSVWSVLFVLLSLVIFVLWEIGINISMVRYLRDEASLFHKSGKSYLKAKEKTERGKKRQKVKIARFWYAVLIMTISTGVFGVALLICGLIIYLIFGAPH